MMCHPRIEILGSRILPHKDYQLFHLHKQVVCSLFYKNLVYLHYHFHHHILRLLQLHHCRILDRLFHYTGYYIGQVGHYYLHHHKILLNLEHCLNRMEVHNLVYKHLAVC